MKGSTARAVRANVVLFSVSSTIALVPCLGAGLLFGLPDDGPADLPWQGGILVFASLIALLLRWNARRAFDSALQVKKVRFAQKEHLPAFIADDCPRAWLVQLHLELLGLRCGE